jgi:hypothetical protein
MADKQNKLTYVVELDTKSGKVKIDGLTKGFVQAQSAVKNLNSELGKTTKNGLNPMIDKTGLAGATVVELGRTISDSNYGIRGMANNLSQLSTLMITLISTTGGVANGFKALINTLRGPLGIIVLFQIAIAALERFSMQSKELSDNINSIDTAAASAGSDLKILRDVMDDSSLSQEELNRAIKKANAQYKDLNIQVDENGRVTEESRKQIDFKIKSLERLAKATAIQKEIEKLFTEIVKSQVEESKAIQAEEDRYEKLINARGSKDFRAENVQKRRENAIKEIKADFKERREVFQEEVELLEKIAVDEELVDELFKPPKGGRTKKRTEKFVREQLEALNPFFKEFFFDVDKAGNVTAKSIVNSLGEVSNIYKDINESGEKGVFQLSELGREYDEAVQRTNESLKSGLAFLKEEAGKVTDLFKGSQSALKNINEVVMSYSDARIEALARERDYVLNTESLTKSQQRARIKDIQERELKAQRTKIRLEREFFTIKQSLLIAEEIMKIKADFAERKRIFEKVNDNIVAGSVESIADAKFSIGEFVKQLGPAGIAAYALTIGGLIASIFRARKQAHAQLASLGGGSAPSGGDSGGGTSFIAPDFNIVGTTETSQLAQSIATSEQEPVKAYVVTDDISNAQELDRKAISSASLG